MDQISRLNTNDDKFCVVKLFQAGKGRPKLSYFALKCAIIFYIPTESLQKQIILHIPTESLKLIFFYGDIFGNLFY